MRLRLAIHLIFFSFPAESAFIETFMRGLTLPAAGLEAKVRRFWSYQISATHVILCLCLQSDAFPSPGDIASALHKRFWVSNNDMVRGQLVLSHKWMLFIPSHCPAQVAEVPPSFLFRRILSRFHGLILQDGSSNDIAWRPLAVESPKPNNSAKVFYFKAGPKNVSFQHTRLFSFQSCENLFLVNIILRISCSSTLILVILVFQESSVQRSPYVVVDQVTKVQFHKTI